MGIESRPYSGTWKLNAKKVVACSPDALLYVNGDLTLPGCPKCNSRVDIQQFLVQVDCDAGTEPTSGSASFTLAVPIHHHSSLARDARMILKPGLEVHIYERGYFPVKGLFSNLEQPAGELAAGPLGATRELPETRVPTDTVKQALVHAQETMKWNADQRSNADLIWNQFQAAGMPATTTLGAIVNAQAESGMHADSHGYPGGLFQLDFPGGASPRAGFQDGTAGGIPDKIGQRYGDPNHTVIGWNVYDPSLNTQRIILAAKDANYNSAQDKTVAAAVANWNRVVERPKKDNSDARVALARQMFGDSVVSDSNLNQTASAEAPISQTVADRVSAKPQTRSGSQVGSPTLSQQGLGGYDIENILAYPYYHVFHGVVTSVGMAYDAGVQTFTCQCISMLQLWQYLPVSVNASIFGARAINSKNHASIMGHNFTGMHPYAIIYRLYEDLAGAGAGVSWALSQKTNVDAKFNGESHYSIMQKYWEKRFNTSQIKLRMHGARGDLFNAFEATLLGRYISSADLTNSLKDRFGSVRGTTSDKVFGKSVGANMGNKKRLETLVVDKGLGAAASGDNAQKPGGDFDLNMAEMVAFTTKLGQIGQFQLFESTYETKMNIAQEVTKVTGFEFYQDVDGDFVFKPPFYNLDTSDAKVYRIEDIDIISLQVDEKEPQFTYIVAKGEWFKNQEGYGLENEWGVQGTYVDYRLVAQFGWRMATFECHYFNDAKSVFFMSMNQMDIQNAHTHTASLTIPLRPEIRPGYPVYIVSLDCYYYVTNIAHSFAMGGRCTTALTLTAKRAKFYAPGDYRKTGIEAIDLGNSTLPEKPLEVLDAAGRPRLSGFPNVVMALDPEQISPMFFVLGADIDLINTPQKMQNLITAAVQHNVLSVDPNNSNVFTFVPTNGGNKVMFYFDVSQGSSPGTKPQGAIDFKTAAMEWGNAPKKQAEGREKAVQEVNAWQLQIAGLNGQIQKVQQIDTDMPSVTLAAAPTTKTATKGTPAKGTTTKKGTKVVTEASKAAVIAKLEAQIKTLTDKVIEKNKTIEAEGILKSMAGKDSALMALIDVIYALGAAYRATSGQPNTANLASTANLLDILSDKKAVISTATLPGSYRYYSASHPDPTQQGQREPNFDGWQTGENKANALINPLLLPEWQKTPVQGYLPSDQIVIPEGMKKKPEAQLGDLNPQWGIRVLTHNPAIPNGEVIPTSEIKEFSWASHQLNSRVKKGSTQKGSKNDSRSTANLRGGMQAETKALVKAVPLGATISKMLDPWLASFNDRVLHAVLLLKSDKTNPFVPNFATIPPPSFITINKYPFPTNVPLTSYKFSDTPETSTKTSYYGASKDKLAATDGAIGVWDLVAEVYADYVFSAYNSGLETWQADLLVHANLLDPKYKEKMDALTGFFNQLVGIGKAVPTDSAHFSKDAATHTFISSPVFPVSDARGYQVVGSFRYGRDVTIEPNGVFDVLHKQDPLSMLDQSLVVKVVDDLTKTHGIDSITQQKMIQQLRAGMSDQQLIDLHLLTKNPDSNVLELSFQNWWAEKGRDGVQKVPVNNAAYSLADLTTVSNKGICTCKAAEASIILEAAGTTGFLGIASPADNMPTGLGGTTADNITPWLQHSAEQAGQQWKMTQDALRGVQLSKQPNTIVKSALSLKDQMSQAGAEADLASAKLNASVDAASAAAKKIRQGGH